MSTIRICFVALLVALAAVSPVAAVADAGGEPVHSSAAVDPTTECSFPITETDDMGVDVTLEEEPETVVTLNPSAAQTMWEIGAEEKVIGTTKHAENLEGAEDRTNISTDAETIEPEIVVDLDPDLVLAPSSNFVSEETVETLRESGVTVFYFQSAESIDEVRDRTLLVGSLVGECDGAEDTVDWMDEELEIVESALEDEERPDVLYTFFGFTAGSETFIHDMIVAGGATNVAAEAGVEEYQQLSEETVIDADPEWIVLNTNSPDVPDGSAYESTTAVENDQVLVVEANLLNRPGPRVIHAVTTFAETFHPEAYADATADAVDDADNGANETDDADATAEVSDDADGATVDAEDDDGADDQSTTDGTDDDDQPGFGVAAALVAIVAVLATVGSSRYRHTRR
ncbi:PGF-CTERM-anchored ABC transporter substrate-binding protein [Natrarchaeobius chitinivorans]|uniref:PGF-CTERM sorting domain-containing protein n=1 Tax=Natrarchaeobius chitinivorans TaxID=1679083 RepID=A0A3N6P8S2_NATCH|nr:PGF-CTERM-anchored ABC transporter substrate-binding protein [Natrarchaeobius chitinivorans]RQG95109.1 PGF-CTERM sorting domain-containing protein [Natrarchaeobius chitinivorans]